MILLDTNVISEPLKASCDKKVLSWIDEQVIPPQNRHQFRYDYASSEWRLLEVANCRYRSQEDSQISFEIGNVQA